MPAISLLLALPLAAFADVPTPKEFFGFDVCQDYQLANYKQYEAYLKALAKGSDRIRLVEMGKTEDGRTQWMAVISDPLNLKYLDRHRSSSVRLGRAKDFRDDAEAMALAKKSKAVVWIDGGLHANEVLATQHLIEQAHQLVSRNDEENRRVLRDCIVLLVHANPDGMDLMSDWYMRRTKPEDRSTAGLPVLYQKYAGHDNNRDFYASNLAETRNMNRVLYHEWLPQIVYNHHQSAPQGTIMYIPPFRNPYNYHVDPLVQISTDLVGTTMHQRLISEGKGGTVMRNGASFSAWWNGGLRTTTYFHNMVGILTETWGSPNPTRVPFLLNRQKVTTDLPKPIDVAPWRLRQSLEYEISANYAILDFASRNREKLLFNFYRAGRNSIERGSQDHWTRYPSRLDALGEAALSRPDLRDARVYLLPAAPRDPGSQEWFLERLRITGVEIDRLKASATIGGKTYPAGTVAIRSAQAFRGHVLDMFEPQDHPNDFQYPGGPPIAPYDNAGYTLAYQMGIEFDRILDSAEFETEPYRKADRTAPSQSRNDIDAYRKLNDEAGANRVRVGLWDRYGGSMESGWTRFLLERFNFKFEVIFGEDFDRGNLRERFDVILLPSGAVPAGGAGGGGGGNAMAELRDDPTVPAEFKRRMTPFSIDKSLPELRKFVEAGGHVVAIGSSSLNLARHFDLPVENALVERNADGRTVRLPSTKFFIPGSVVRLKVEPGELTQGMTEQVDVMFDDSPAFRITGPAAKAVAGFDTDKPLRSGWAWGQEYLKDTTAVADATLGQGKVVLIGPEALFRAQPTQSMKLVFNALLRAKG